jgi:aminomethyltransferase
VGALRPGRSRYHLICDERGGIIDDAIVYRLGEELCLLVVNAGNTRADIDWLLPKANALGGVKTRDITADVAMIALQGPDAVAIADGLSGGAASGVRRFRIGEINIAGLPCRIARTGYTGEDGFEIMPPAAQAAGLWSALREAGAAECGLGARDVLRLEAGLMLHGNDMTVENNPYEAGLQWTISPDKGDGYLPGPALKRIAESGAERVIAGFRMAGRSIPRHGMAIIDSGRQAGSVTSGTHSPTIDAAIGIGYVDRGLTAPGTALEIDIRGRLMEATVVELPFYKRSG